MKKALFVILCAITCMTLNSCNEEGSGHRVPQTKQSHPPIVSTEAPAPETKQPVDTVTFVPSSIRVSAPVENPNDSVGEGMEPAHTYSAQVYFLNSDSGYFVQIELDAQSYLKENKETREQGEREIKNAKKLFNAFTTGKASDFRVKYDARTGVEIFDNKPVEQKKIGNALIVPSAPEPIYSSSYRFQKEIIGDYAGMQ